MASYKRDEIIKVLQAFDKLIEHECELVLIGGTAVILGYDSARGTKDTETWNRLEASVIELWNKAGKSVGLNLQIDTAAAVAQAPEDFESRLEKLRDVQFEKLTVKYPDPYHLVLMKVCRNADIDRQDIQHIHSYQPLDPDVLLNRFRYELVPIYLGSRTDLLMKYEFIVEVLFGEKVAEAQRKELGGES